MKHNQTTNDIHLTRRDFLKVAGGLGLSAAGMTLLEACGVKPATPTPEDAPLETTTIRISSPPDIAVLCLAPQYLAEALLHNEGFITVQYVPLKAQDVGANEQALIADDADICLAAAPPVIIQLDAGQPLVILSGSLVGCFELFGTNQVQTITDLRGKTIPVAALGNSQYVFLSSIVAWAGLDPNNDINWVVQDPVKSVQLFAEGKVDALIAFPPAGQELRAKKIGHVILNSMMDKPWSQYYCCMPTVRREFLQKNPVATKRALRAFLKATDICAQHPERAAQSAVDRGVTDNYNYALDFFSAMPYSHWRDYDPADTLTFYANRLRDAGLIKSNANDIIARGTDWTFLNEIKAELKG